MSKERLNDGLVIVLPGVEGHGPFNEAIRDGLAAGWVDCGIELRDWTLPLGPLYNLRAEGRNRRKAAELAERVIRYRTEYPGRPVVLVGQSGGGAIAVWAAEKLPPEHKVDGLILIAPALSPNYVLDGALARSNRGIVNFHSSRDWFFLGVMTTVWGTMDGEHEVSAGRAGFEIPTGKEPAGGPQGRAELYQKLYQIGWSSEMAERGHHGWHITSGAAGFVAYYVAPFVLAGEWDSEFVSRVLSGTTFPEEAEPAPEPRPATRPAPASRAEAEKSPAAGR